MILRSENPADLDAISVLVDQAFGESMPSLLIDLVRRSDRFVPDLSIVAEDNGTLLGHILFSYVTVEGEESFEVLSLAPLAVRPDHQNRGVGSALTEEGLLRAERRGESLVVVEGHPGYYPRFGFEQASLHGIEKATPSIPSEAFMVRRLSSYDPRFRGQLVYPPAFHDADLIGP